MDLQFFASKGDDAARESSNFNEYVKAEKEMLEKAKPVESITDPARLLEAPKGVGNTGTVLDRIKATQPVYDGTSIPKSFNIKIGENEFWVNPNGTKHMLEYVGSKGKNVGTFSASISSQEMLASFDAALAEAIKNNGIVTDKMIYGGGWEFILSAPRETGLNVVIKHARINP